MARSKLRHPVPAIPAVAPKTGHLRGRNETVTRGLRGLVRAWKTVTEFVGHVVSVIILTVIYIVVGVPTGLVLRLFGKPPMRMKPGGPSTWEPREKRAPGLEDARQPF